MAVSEDGEQLPMLAPDEIPENAVILHGGRIIDENGPIGLLDYKAVAKEVDLDLQDGKHPVEATINGGAGL
jgi:hypothetical protein